MNFHLLFSHLEMSPYMLGKLKFIIIGLAKLLQQVTLNLNNLPQQRFFSPMQRSLWVGGLPGWLSSTQSPKDSISKRHNFNTQLPQTLPKGKMEDTHWLLTIFAWRLGTPFKAHWTEQVTWHQPNWQLLLPHQAPAQRAPPPWRPACIQPPSKENKELHPPLCFPQPLIHVSNSCFSDCFVILLSHFSVSPTKGKKK